MKGLARSTRCGNWILRSQRSWEWKEGIDVEIWVVTGLGDFFFMVFGKLCGFWRGGVVYLSG
jgi:hypothetical protein